MIKIEFFKYLLSSPVLTPLIPQLAAYGLIYWFFPMTYGFQILMVVSLDAIVGEYGRFLAADGPQDPAITAKDFIDMYVPALLYYGLILAACCMLVLFFLFPQLIPVWNVCIFGCAILPSYYMGKYIGIKYGLRVF